MTCNVGCTSTPVIEAPRKPDCERGSSRPDVLPALQLRAVDVDLSASRAVPHLGAILFQVAGRVVGTNAVDDGRIPPPQNQRGVSP